MQQRFDLDVKNVCEPARGGQVLPENNETGRSAAEQIFSGEPVYVGELHIFVLHPVLLNIRVAASNKRDPNRIRFETPYGSRKRHFLPRAQLKNRCDVLQNIPRLAEGHLNWI